MSVLRERLKRPELYLIALSLLAAGVGIDSLRRPESQIAARAYIGAVREYQVHLRPLLQSHIRCRYRPTCSEYSIEAVRVHGLAHGLALTIRRLRSCTPRVAMGTFDPVPTRSASR
jgi:putative membrane protein insertion efficiency factor